VVEALDEAALNWGVKVLRYEIKDLTPPAAILHSMQAQITAEREKRALIAASEGRRQEQINIATGEREAFDRALRGREAGRDQQGSGRGRGHHRGGRSDCRRHPQDRSRHPRSHDGRAYALNVLGTPLVPCSYDPLTGWYRDGCCHTDAQDHGSHVICARMTPAFLNFSSSSAATT
jgi:hypothetical protein